MKMLSASLLRSPGVSVRLAGALGLLSIAGFAIPAATAAKTLADISINIGIEAPPPPPRQEVIVGISPGPDFIWIGGYWDGAPGHYRWVGGRWGRPPHAHGEWSAPHWDRDKDGHYRQTKGEWRDDDSKH
jgi:hypothetical protein